MFIDPRDAPQRVLLTTLTFQGRIADDVQHAIARRRQSAQHVSADGVKQSVFVPPPAPDHPQQCPVLQARRHNPADAFERALVWCQHQAD